MTKKILINDIIELPNEIKNLSNFIGDFIYLSSNDSSLSDNLIKDNLCAINSVYLLINDKLDMIDSYLIENLKK